MNPKSWRFSSDDFSVQLGEFSLAAVSFPGLFPFCGKKCNINPSIMVDVPKYVYVRLPVAGNGFTKLFPTANFPQFQDGIFLVKGLRNFDVKIAGHPKAVVQKYIRNLMEKPGKKSTSLSFCWNRIFKDGS